MYQAGIVGDVYLNESTDYCTLPSPGSSQKVFDALVDNRSYVGRQQHAFLFILQRNHFDAAPGKRRDLANTPQSRSWTGKCFGRLCELVDVSDQLAQGSGGDIIFLEQLHLARCEIKRKHEAA